MKTTPDTSGGFCCTLHSAPLQRLDFSTRRIEQKLDFSLDSGDLEAVQRDDLLVVID